MRRRRDRLLAMVSLSLLVLSTTALSGCANDARSPLGEAGGRERASSEDILAGKEAPVHGFRVVATYDHDRGNFTEGLALEGGTLYEGTGLYGRSKLVKTDLDSGEVLAELTLGPEYFGEGVTVLGDEVFQLTYTSNLGFVYDAEGFTPRRTFAYAGEGWGLADNGEELIMSDGSSTLHFLNPATGGETRRVTARDNLGPLENLNELEYIAGEIYANVWKTSLIAIISATTGEVTGWIDLAGLNPDPVNLKDPHVLNGIAHDAAGGRLLVTGKCWPCIYGIELVPADLTGS